MYQDACSGISSCCCWVFPLLSSQWTPRWWLMASTAVMPGTPHVTASSSLMHSEIFQTRSLSTLTYSANDPKCDEVDEFDVYWIEGYDVDFDEKVIVAESWYGNYLDRRRDPVNLFRSILGIRERRVRLAIRAFMVAKSWLWNLWWVGAECSNRDEAVFRCCDWKHVATDFNDMYTLLAGLVRRRCNFGAVDGLYEKLVVLDHSSRLSINLGSQCV
jgi:hypothetical protein